MTHKEQASSLCLVSRADAPEYLRKPWIETGYLVGEYKAQHNTVFDYAWPTFSELKYSKSNSNWHLEENLDREWEASVPIQYRAAFHLPSVISKFCQVTHLSWSQRELLRIGAIISWSVNIHHSNGRLGRYCSFVLTSRPIRASNALYSAPSLKPVIAYSYMCYCNCAGGTSRESAYWTLFSRNNECLNAWTLLPGVVIAVYAVIYMRWCA